MLDKGLLHTVKVQDQRLNPEEHQYLHELNQNNNLIKRHTVSGHSDNMKTIGGQHENSVSREAVYKDGGINYAK